VRVATGIWKTTLPAPFSIEDFTVDNTGIVWAIDNWMGNSVAAYIGGAWYTDTDSFDSALIEAAKKAADKAKLSADTAASNAIDAKTSANTAATRAQTSINQTIDAGTSAASWAHQSFDKANAASQDVAYIKNTQIPSILTKIDNINNTIASDNVPPVIQKVAGKNGATCTTSGIFNIVVSATDNNSGQLWAQARVDEGSWTSWFNIPQSFIPLTLSAAGSHTITVNVKDVSGNISSTSMTAFRI